VKKFEALMGKFIWNNSGKILRIAIDEIKNNKLAGGLQLPCLANMADSLLVSQCLRLIRGGDKKCMKHLEFWLGDLLGNFVPGIGQGVRSVDTPDYFGCIGGLLADMLATDILTADTLKTLTNKAVYAEMTSSFHLQRWLERVTGSMGMCGLGCMILWWRSGPEICCIYLCITSCLFLRDFLESG
jgi:hypothetical protein